MNVPLSPVLVAATPGPAAADLQNLRSRLVDMVLGELDRRNTPPRATYRLQFHGGFGFSDATKIVPYLAAVGISHVYASPLLQARPGSAHGYDVCNHLAIDEELGGADGFAAWVAALAQHDLRLILDIVPNHMSTHATNTWWTDVLENGPSSPYARFFDVDWVPVKPELHGRVLLPVLGKQYGAALEAGELQIEFRDGAFFVRYFERALPLDPKTTNQILTDHLDDLRNQLSADADSLAEFESIVTALEHLPPTSTDVPEQVAERQRDKEIIKRRLRELAARSPLVTQFLAANVARINGDAAEVSSFDPLDSLLAVQPYRLCHWKAAGDEVNYRRFFDINELAALCTEDPEVFHKTHQFILQLLGEGALSGVRVDHIDGLYAPERYLWRLQWSYLAELVRRAFVVEMERLTITGPMVANGPSTEDGGEQAASDRTDWLDLAPLAVVDLCRRLELPLPAQEDWLAILGSAPQMIPAPLEDTAPPTGAMPAEPTLPLYVLVEKILGPHEPLPESWPVAGTTGYDFLKSCDGLFVPAAGLRQLKRDYARFTGQAAAFDVVAHDSKLLILRVAMAGELQMLAHRLSHLAEQHRRSRDFTLNMLRYALREILVCFPVYRIYPGPSGVSERDRRFVAQATALAKRRNPAIDPSLFDFIRDVLLLEHPDGLSAAQKQQRELFAGRFQQVTSPVMAKGVEDTAFYAYCPLLSVNEVGNGPESPAVEPAVFHAWNQQRAQVYPHTMLTSSTHDTKRSEDVRARLHMLAEIPRAWRSATQRWARLNRRRRAEVDGLPAPSRSDEHLFYQSLLGIWPPQPADHHARDVIAERMRRYMDKAGHEAKQRTSWINPNDAYDRAVADFVTAALDDRRDNRFLADFLAWQPQIARLGLITALAEVTLKFTCPGVPDLYQGQETWQFRLVDPDNRLAVNYEDVERHFGELQEMVRAAGENCGQLARDLAANLANPLTKLYVTWRLLQLRARLTELFADGRYVPLSPAGSKFEHVVAFARTTNPDERRQSQWAIVVVPRLIGHLVDVDPATSEPAPLPLGADVWGDTHLALPPELSGEYQDVFTSTRQALRERFEIASAIQDFPVAVLVRTSANSA